MTLKLWRKAGDQFFGSNGDPLGAGQLEYIEFGTSNQISLFSDRLGNDALANPISLNSVGRLETPVYIDDGVVFNETISDDGSVIEEGLKYSLDTSTAGSTAEFALPKRTGLDVSSSLTLTTTHRGYELNCTASSEIIITLDAVTNWANGHSVVIRHTGGTENIKLQTVNSELINGASELVIKPEDKWALISSAGSEWLADTRTDIALQAGIGLTGDGSTVSPLTVDAEALKSDLSGPDVVLIGERLQVDGGEASDHLNSVKRFLNVEMCDRDNEISLDDSVFTINRVGECLIKWSAPAYECGTHQAVLSDNTNSLEYPGSTEVSEDGSGVTSRSEGQVKLNITASTDFQIDHSSTATNTSGFGVTSLSNKSQYTKVEVYFL